MRQIYKDTVIGFILASFVFSPVAFAKPSSSRVKTATKSTKPLYTNLENTIRSNKKGLKISSFVSAAEPMVKNREFRDLKKGFLPYWDKKFDKMIVGNDHFLVEFKGQKVFGRFVDRGPIAFIINGKPLLWKDVLIYGKAKKRILDILGVRTSNSRKVSFQDFILEQLFPKAYGITEDYCKDLGKDFIPEGPDGKPTCACPTGMAFKYGAGCQPTGEAVTCENMPGSVPNDDKTACVCASGSVWTPENLCNSRVEPEPVVTEEKKDNKWGLIIFGAAALLILFLMLKKKKKPTTPTTPTDPIVDPPVPGWTPEPEGQCPTPGARGLTEADLPPECRKTTCSDTNSCAPTSDGVIN
jgi:hypothetical protein